jgi:hypothetical protein
MFMTGEEVVIRLTAFGLLRQTKGLKLGPVVRT